MAKSPTELIAEFGPVVGTLGQRVDTVEKSVEGLIERQGAASDLLKAAQQDIAVIREQLTHLRVDIGPDLKVDIGILKRDVEELKKTKEQWAQRLWNLLGPLVGAAAGALLTYYLRKT
jgi:hypothetical protein